jgi:hypothetical protein
VLKELNSSWKDMGGFFLKLLLVCLEKEFFLELAPAEETSKSFNTNPGTTDMDNPLIDEKSLLP